MLLLATGFAAGLVTVLGVTLSPSVASQGGGGAAGQPEQLRTLDRRGIQASAGDFDRFRAIAVDEGNVEVIVGLRTVFTPEGLLSAGQVEAQHVRIAQAREGLLRSLASTDFSVLRTYETVPYVALRMSEGALDALRGSAKAASLHPNERGRPLLFESSKIVEATESFTVGRAGTGQDIAILDTGVEKSHPFLQQTAAGPSKVISEACYSQNSDCPNGQTSDTSADSGEECTYAPKDCDHGTHVAGIAAGRGASAGQNFSGVARNAKLISIQVFSSDCTPAPCATYHDADLILALQRVLQLKQAGFNIAAVNMSLGTSTVAGSGFCDGNPLKAEIDNLLTNGIPTVIAAGNSYSSSGVSSPACISTAVTVGSTTDADTVSCFSNSSTAVDLLAPGGGDASCDDPKGLIKSSVPPGLNQGAEYEEKAGTSQAAPHVSGAFAVMRSATPTWDPSTILSYLQATGKQITDPYNGVTRSRIGVLAASVYLNGDTRFKSAGTFSFQGGDVASNGVGLSARRGGAPRSGAISLSGIPTGAVVQNAYLYWMTIGGPDNTVIFRGPNNPVVGGSCVLLDPNDPEGALKCTGTLVGASRDTGWDINRQEPNRVYRATVPAANVPGNATYAVGGVGRKDNGSDGQGASLVAIYSRAASTLTGRVYLRHGAMTGNVGETMNHFFSGLTVPTPPSQVNLHVAMGDGQTGPNGEDPMLFEGSPVTTANFFFGADGPMWDDGRIPISTGLLPAGTGDRSNSIHVVNDPLVWAYAALAYQHP